MEAQLRNVALKYNVGFLDFARLDLKTLLESNRLKSASELSKDLQELLPSELLSSPRSAPLPEEDEIGSGLSISVTKENRLASGRESTVTLFCDYATEVISCSSSSRNSKTASRSKTEIDDRDIDSWDEYSCKSSSDIDDDDDDIPCGVDLSGFEIDEQDEITEAHELRDVPDDDSDDNMSSLTCGITSSSSQSSNLDSTSRRKLSCPHKICNCSLWVKGSGCCNVCRFFYDCQCYDCGKASSSDKDGEKDSIIEKLRIELERYQTKERCYDFAYIKGQIERCYTNTTNSSYWQYDWRIGRLDDAVKCCSKAFRTFYNFSKSTFDNISRELKHKRLLASQATTQNPTEEDIAKMVKFSKGILGYKLQSQTQSLLRGTQTLTWEVSKSWFKRFTELHCNEEPNRRGERHFNKGYSKKQVYAEYKKDLNIRKDGVKSFSYASFCKMWKRAFPEVRCRKFQAGVQTKCVECAILEYEGNEAKTNAARYEVQMLHYYHSIKYKGQREWYHNIREECIQCANFMTAPGGKLSMIGDGMAQVHNAIPTYGQSGTTIAKSFDTHFQGVITHGKRFTIYRTYGNCGKVSFMLYSLTFHFDALYILLFIVGIKCCDLCLA